MRALDIVKRAEDELKDRFRALEEMAFYNQVKVLKALQKHHIRDVHFNSSSGYGYGDIGRDVLEEVYKDVFAAEDALVRGQIVSGTHAISACLFGLMRPGEKLVSVTGAPYDTLQKVIGKNNSLSGTLLDKGIIYQEVGLTAEGRPDGENIKKSIDAETKIAFIQRSRGYSLRPALTVEEIGELVKIIKKANPSTIIMVDNCYGEFTDIIEPTEVGVDIMAGSLIKNPGGGLAPSGGYVVGKKELVEQVAYHITAPGLGKELGASLINNRCFYQGIFMAPHVVLQALKGALLLAYIFEEHGYEVYPSWQEKRGDIVQAIRLGSTEEVLAFCQVIQNSSPVDSDVQLEYGDMPGYDNKVVMAAGTFIQGSSIELSCDAPLRSPYCVYVQGGLTYEHVRYAAVRLIEEILWK
ncbi:Cystathionine beta-lyase family protein involved in aluminum resistance [Thermosyntropha lipolytica DSM 11003]|uniref:Cystathionine beta-lyase family protein involved in aluminum resistance n=1 Tax=Thermosyntropha lipolytica DSM 11003 TaxID=1123382 RepID=A0A1M5PM13_9FIRM|nr:methionine gamma-lyase family protein [Thermosyntropha lipolytica]SHH02818.1 Cystathionine beta-lyase family protein involved in aluminum resistance [Thermosyntropha lipolytica DSM 11003]